MNDTMEYHSEKELPDSVRKFINNVHRAGYDNIYHVRSVDIDGTIIDEKFGMNVMTNKGLKIMFGSISANTRYMWTGLNNDVEPQTTDTSITEVSPFPNSMKTGTLAFTAYPSVYHPETHILTSLCLRYQDFYYDYNYSGITEDVEIKEIGYGTSPTDLSMHALIYDEYGNKSSIIKKPNTRLYISVYIQAGINVDLFDQLWRKGIYFFTTPNAWLFRDEPAGDDIYLTMCYMTRRAQGPVHANHRYMDYSHHRGYNVHVDAGDDTIYQTKVDQNGTGVRDWQYDYISTICFGDIYTDANNLYEDKFTSLNFWGFKLIQMNESEDIVIERAYTNSSSSDNFSNMFGLTTDFHYNTDMTNNSYGTSSDGMLPMTHFSIEDISLYNHKTKQWDIPEEFVSDPEYLYDEINSTYMGRAYMKDQSGVAKDCVIFINYKADKYKIKSFSNSNVTMYASDAWWDVSTWSPILADLNDIPTEYQQKRYYILTQWITDKPYQLRPVYYKDDATTGLETTTFHGLKLPTEKFPYTVAKIPNDSVIYKSPQTRYAFIACSNKNNWFIICDYIIYPENPSGVKCYKIGEYNNGAGDSGWISYSYTTNNTMFSTDDRLVTTFSKYRLNGKFYYGLRIYALDNEGSIAPKYVDIPLSSISGDLNYYTRSYGTRFSTSSKGWVMYNSDKYWHPIILDIYGESNTNVLENLVDVDFDRKPKCYQLTDKLYKYAHVQNLTDFLVYYNSNAETANVIEIMDMKTREVIQSFTLPTDRQYTVVGIHGWNDIVYITATANSAYYLFMYTMADEKIVHLGMSSFSIFNHSDVKSYDIPEMSNEYVYCLGSSTGDYRAVFVTKEDPTNFKYFTKHKYSAYRNVVNGQLHFTDDQQTHMVLSTFNDPETHWYTYNWRTIYDMWDLIDNGPNLTMPYKNFFYTYTNQGIDNIPVVLYKDRVMRISDSGEPNFGEITSYPIQYSLPHRMHGKTKTLTAWNNPFQVTKGLYWQTRWTNDINKIKAISSGDQPSPTSNGDNNG